MKFSIGDMVEKINKNPFRDINYGLIYELSNLSKIDEKTWYAVYWLNSEQVEVISEDRLQIVERILNPDGKR